MPKRLTLALCALIVVAATPGLAEAGGKDRHKGGHGGHPQWQQHHHPQYKFGPGKHGPRGHAVYHHGGPVVVWKPKKHHPPAIVPPSHGHRHGSGHNRRQDDDWAIFALLALQIAEVLNDNQRNSHASAQRQVASAPLGSDIVWNDGGAGGRIVATREGNDRAGRYCREFQQEIFVGQRRESGYGIACRQPDGDWEIVS
jgi:hypothetical protein